LSILHGALLLLNKSELKGDSWLRFGAIWVDIEKNKSDLFIFVWNSNSLIGSISSSIFDTGDPENEEADEFLWRKSLRRPTSASWGIDGVDGELFVGDSL